MVKVLVDENLLDNLLEKALPKEYDVLLEGYGLDEEEEDYFYLILALLEGHVEIILDWLQTDDGKRILEDAGELGINFFDELEYKIRLKLHDSFVSLIVPLLLSWYTYGNKLAYNELNQVPVFTDTDWKVFNQLKQQNYNVVTDLSKDVNVTLRDALYDGINQGLDIDELTQLLKEKGLKGKGKFSSDTRAEMIARTERTNLINNAKYNSFLDNGVEWVDVVTMGDERVCSICLEMEAGNPYPINQVQLPSYHPTVPLSYSGFKTSKHELKSFS